MLFKKVITFALISSKNGVGPVFVNSAVRVTTGIDPWSLSASNPGQFNVLSASDRISDGIQTAAFGAAGHAFSDLKEASLGIQMIDVVGFKTFTDTQIWHGLGSINSTASSISATETVFSGIQQNSSLLKDAF